MIFYRIGYHSPDCGIAPGASPIMAAGWPAVRAVVADPAGRTEFDRWYRDEQHPDAMEVFAVTTAWRG